MEHVSVPIALIKSSENQSLNPRILDPFLPTHRDKSKDLQHVTACGPYIFPAAWKIGRYMATTIPPMEPPRKTISKGSSMDVSAATATSTSSS